jgi:hypothetical protein
MPICARQRHVITQTEIQSELGSGFPVVLDEKAVLIVCGSRPELDFVIRTTLVAGIALREHAHHEAGHGIAAAHVLTAGARVGAILVEAELADRGVGLDVVDLVNSSVEAKLQFMRATHLVECDRKLSGILSQPVVAIRIGADVGVSGAGVLVDEDCRDPFEAIASVSMRGSPECLADRPDREG